MPDVSMISAPVRTQFGSMANHGLLFAKRFTANGMSETVNEAPEALPSKGDSWLWAHLDLVDRRASIWMSHMGLAEDILNFLTSDDVRQIADYEGRMLYGTIFEPSDETPQFKSRQGLLRFVVTRQWLITGRFNPVTAIEKLKLRTERGDRFVEPLDILAKLMAGFFRHLQDQVGEMQSNLDHIEDRVLDSGGTGHSATLATTRRRCANLLRQIAHYQQVQHEISNALPRLRAARRHIELAHDYAERFDGLRNDIQSLLERARLAKDEIASILAMEMNRSLYVLSLISALLLPPSVIFSLFGINAGGLPMVHSENGFLAVLLVGLLSASVVFLILRRRS